MRQPVAFMSASEARALWAYDPGTGRILSRDSGLPADDAMLDGYRLVRHGRISIRAHRLAWVLAHGEWPTELVDHINGDRADNRLANLRDVSHRVNQQNQKHHRATGTHRQTGGTQEENGGTKDRDTSRARARPFGDAALCPCVPAGTQMRDATTGTRDATPPGIASRSLGAVAEKTRAHAAKLATDPRFAGWLGLMAQDDPAPYPAAIARRQERDELRRLCCLRTIAMAERGCTVDAVALEDARDFVATHPPLGRPLGTGNPDGA